MQVADRWHLWHNLGEAVERAVTRHHACLREPVAEDEEAAAASAIVAAPVRESRLVARTQQRYAAVQERLAGGCSIPRISRELDLERGTACTADAAQGRQVTTWIMQEPTRLGADEQESLVRVLDRCPELNALTGHVRAFAEMMGDLRG